MNGVPLGFVRFNRPRSDTGSLDREVSESARRLRPSQDADELIARYQLLISDRFGARRVMSLAGCGRLCHWGLFPRACA